MMIELSLFARLESVVKTSRIDADHPSSRTERRRAPSASGPAPIGLRVAVGDGHVRRSDADHRARGDTRFDDLHAVDVGAVAAPEVAYPEAVRLRDSARSGGERPPCPRRRARNAPPSPRCGSRQARARDCPHASVHVSCGRHRGVSRLELAGLRQVGGSPRRLGGCFPASGVRQSTAGRRMASSRLDPSAARGRARCACREGRSPGMPMTSTNALKNFGSASAGRRCSCSG